MKTINLLAQMLMAAVLLFTISCQKEEIDEIEEEPIEIDISGVVQKGPFNVGTTVTLSELNDNFSQTGKTFVTQINNDDGSFELRGVQLSNPFVEIKADGFYFDEIKGENSAARLTLNAIADITNKSTLNINVLTHLEKPRVEYLLANGYTFKEAKTKAKQEVLNIFNLSGSDSDLAETLDITKSGTENACLLALSAVVQGYRPVADVSALLTYIANDLKDDGTLDGAGLQTDLVSHALFIDTTQVMENIIEKYDDLDGTIELPNFGQYLEQFISTTTYAPINFINYPEQTSNGLNILNANNSNFGSESEVYYSMAAKTLSGIPLTVELKLTEGTVPGSVAWWYRGNQINWKISDYDLTGYKQNFQVLDLDQMSELEIRFTKGATKIQIKYTEGIRERIRIITIN